MSGESPVSPKLISYPILRVFRISAQPAAVEALCIFSRRHNNQSLTFLAAVLDLALSQ
ncbi:MAG: hypothetical protein FWC50_09315 [Planctomycetaceae bacterium]|nr:hypothetical protein [Planctomycetaceae bacterium]